MHSQLSRRQLLQTAGCGFGYLALASLATQQALAASDPLSPRKTHHPPRAKRIIFLFMHGGPSQVDTFDYKPRLERDDGKQLPFEPAKGTTVSRTLLKSPWKFRQYGECGHYVSDLFPHIATHVDELCFLSGMHTEGQSHGQAVLTLHTGVHNLTRPSMGSWIVYGLGTENQNLPGFITICPTRGHGGALNYGSAFLPAIYQGTAIGSAGSPASSAQIRYLSNKDRTAEQQRRQLDLLQSLNREHLARSGDDDRLDGVIESYELAFRMQSAVPRLTDLSGESAAVLKLYGIGEKPTDDFGRQCFAGPSLCRGRRAFHPSIAQLQVGSARQPAQGAPAERSGSGSAHRRPSHRLAAAWSARRHARAVGRRVWPNSRGAGQGWPRSQSAGLHGLAGRWRRERRGLTHGATDEFGYYAVQGKVHMHDLHATLLWALGLDHEKLTYRYAGRDFRLTDVYGNVVKEIFA
jgi:hypothetical protein